MRNGFHRFVVLCLAGWAAISGCSGAYGPQQVAQQAPQQTPETVFETAKAAAQRKDWGAFYDCLTPETQDQFVAVSLSAVGMAKSFMAFAALAGPEKLKEIQAKMQPVNDVLQKHGISDQALQEAQAGSNATGANPLAFTQLSPEQTQRLIALVKDRPAFFGDMMGAATQVGDEGKSPLPNDTRLENVTVEGDVASGTTVRGAPGSEKRQDIKFRRMNGVWKIDFPMQNLNPSAGAAPTLEPPNEGSPTPGQ